MKCPPRITALTRSMICARSGASGVSVSKSGTAIAGNNRTLSAVITAASVTASLVTFATHVVQHLGLPGVCLLIVMSQVAIVPGTEATMLFAGFSVDNHHLSL